MYELKFKIIGQPANSIATTSKEDADKLAKLLLDTFKQENITYCYLTKVEYIGTLI
jgi:hypothetical protein